MVKYHMITYLHINL